MCKFTIFDDELEKDVHVYIYTQFNPCPTLIIRSFNVVFFQEPLEGFYGPRVFMLSGKEFNTAGAADVKAQVPSVLVLVIDGFNLFFLFDLTTLSS